MKNFRDFKFNFIKNGMNTLIYLESSEKNKQNLNIGKINIGKKSKCVEDILNINYKKFDHLNKNQIHKKFRSHVQTKNNSKERDSNEMDKAIFLAGNIKPLKSVNARNINNDQKPIIKKNNYINRGNNYII
jgi:hypothetical protein